MNPNPDNYTSLEVSQRLVAAEIVLETDQGWYCHLDSNLNARWHLWSKPEDHFTERIPAPSLSELWRELPNSVLLAPLLLKFVLIGVFTKPFEIARSLIDLFRNPNRMADLLIWVKGEKE